VTEAWSPPRAIPAHAHASFSITILLGGAFEESYRPSSVARHAPHTCRPGSLLIRPAGEIHENHLGAQGARTLSVELSPARLDLSARALAPLVALGLRREAAFFDIGLAMANELKLQDSATPFALEGLALALVARVLRVGMHSVRAGAQGPPQWLLRARDSIHDRFCDQSLRVHALAAEAGVHPVYFARAFHRQYGIAPGEYLRSLRQDRAISRVVDSADSLATIAHASGFADQSHMNRAFRRRVGRSPGQLRRRS